MTTPASTTPFFASTPDDLRQALHDLHSPVKLTRSPWLDSCLVAQRRAAHPELDATQALKRVLSDALSAFEQADAELANLLRGRFWDEWTVAQMINAQRPVAQSERRFFEQQNLALERFHALLAEQERLCQVRMPQSRLLARLPIPTYQRLYGVDGYAEQVLAHLQDPLRHPIVSIKGIGGIGKTALADYVLRRFVFTEHAVHDLIWISAKQEYLTPAGIVSTNDSSGGKDDQGFSHIRLEQIFDELALKLALDEVIRLPLVQKIDRLAQVLRAQRYLIVLDNLETVDDFRLLAPWLARLASPTQFLLTARETVPALSIITQVELGELEQAAALELIAALAAEKGVDGFAPAAVHALVGGNPLAIVLVVSQMAFLPPSQVLARVQLGDSDALYRYIFHHSWSILEPAEQDILLTIQRAGDQADWDWLALSTALPAVRLNAGLERLRELSLLQLQRDSTGRPTYAIHRLTSTFLRTEVLGWQ